MVDETGLQALREAFRGELIGPGDARYASARRVWNGMIDKRPAVIARCTGVADVVSAMRYARENNLLVAVRGGGHNVAGNAVCDDGIVIDLSPLKGIRVDPAARTARAQAGVTWGELDCETQLFGLATNGGFVSTTGIAGLTLGGGIGWLARKHGTTCDNLLAADVVTAGGDFLTASSTENEDLFWGLRGGGGNFGIVTSFEYRLQPVGPEVLAGAVFYPFGKAKQVLRSYRDYVCTAPDELTVVAAIWRAGPAPFLPPEVHGKLVVTLAVCHAGDLNEGERLLRPLRCLGEPLADLIAPIPYTALQSMTDESYPAGLQNYWKSNYLTELTDDGIDTFLEHGARITSPASSAYFEHLGGAISRVGEDETAFGHRDVAFDFVILSLWTDPRESDEHIGWAREFWGAMQPFASEGVYVNNLGAEGEDRVRAAYSPAKYQRPEGEDRVRAAYSPAKYQRLVALKDKYDPDNLFRLNQNIKPTAALELSGDHPLDETHAGDDDPNLCPGDHSLPII